jgi:hypothetical protein
MHTDRPFERRKKLRGHPYTLAEFQQKYELACPEAKYLFAKFGPSSIDLDLLMSAKRRAPTIHSITDEISL